MKKLLLIGTLVGGLLLGASLSGAAYAPRPTVAYYQVSAVNAVGESQRSNEVAVVVPAPDADFQNFVTHIQAAAYYAKWVHDNPGDSGRWFAFRDQILAGGRPAAPTMTSQFGAALISAGQLRLDTQ